MGGLVRAGGFLGSQDEGNMARYERKKRAPMKRFAGATVARWFLRVMGELDAVGKKNPPRNMLW